MDIQKLEAELRACENQIAHLQELREKLKALIEVLKHGPTGISRSGPTRSRMASGGHRMEILKYFIEHGNKPAKIRELTEATGIHYSILQYHFNNKEKFEEIGQGRDRTYKLVDSYWARVPKALTQQAWDKYFKEELQERAQGLEQIPEHLNEQAIARAIESERADQ